jgi:hypothetical protein
MVSLGKHDALHARGMVTTKGHSKMRRTLMIALAFLLAFAITPQAAQAATSWSSSGLTGVQASGTYTYSGGVSRVSGRLYDTSGDSRSVRLLVRFSGECCAKVVNNENGNNTSVAFTLSGRGTFDVKENKRNAISSAEGPWVSIN